MRYVRLDLGANRFGDDARASFVVNGNPSRMEVHVVTGPASSVVISLDRADLAMLRGLLANMDGWERAAIAAGMLRPLIDMDGRPGLGGSARR